MHIDTKYNIGQVVEILELEIEARIICIKLEGKNLLYLVEYWSGCEIKTVWQDEDQLIPRKQRSRG